MAPMVRAERDLVRARLAAADGDPTAAAAFLAAIASLRERSTPYHLAHGLLDHAQHLTMHDPEAAEAALGEARDIATRLRCWTVPHTSRAQRRRSRPEFSAAGPRSEGQFLAGIDLILAGITTIR